MSASLCNDYHISLLAEFAVQRPCLPSKLRDATPAEVGQILHAENAKCAGQTGTYEHDASARRDRAILRMNPVQIIKAAQHLQYNSCEHPGWHEGDAKRIINAIIKRSIQDLPGYEQCAWEVGKDGQVQKHTAKITRLPVRWRS